MPKEEIVKETKTKQPTPSVTNIINQETNAEEPIQEEI